MPETGDHDYDDLLGRIAGGAAGISPRADAGGVVHRALARRRRRRAAGAGVLAAAVVVAAGVGSVVALHHLPGDDEPAPAASSAPQAFVDGKYAPAKFYADIVGGRASPTVVRHHLTVGERLYARISWVPEQLPDDKFAVVIALEQADTDPASACADLVMGGGRSCRTRPDGDAVTTYDLPARDAFYDPVHRKAPFETPSPDATVRGVTYLRADGLVVSVFVCRCPSAENPRPIDPPVTDVQLEQIASSDTWINTTATAGAPSSDTGN